MSKRRPVELLSDIVESIKRIETYTRDIAFEKMIDDIMIQDAVVRNLEIIGEAIKNIPSEVKIKHKNIKWKEIAGMRDKLIHFYFGVNWEIVWKAIKENLPALKAEIENIIKELGKK